MFKGAHFLGNMLAISWVATPRLKFNAYLNHHLLSGVVLEDLLTGFQFLTPYVILIFRGA